MDHLIRGAVTFNESVAPEIRETMARLADRGQKPSALLITCIDSRVVPEALFGAGPGDLLVLRNVGAFVPNPEDVWIGGDNSVASGVDFAVNELGVKHIVVMGHGECAGLQQALARRQDVRSDAIGNWLRFSRRALQRFDTDQLSEEGLSDVNRLSQLGVLTSMENLGQMPTVRAKLDGLAVTVHGWWFDIAAANVLAWEPRAGRFLPVQAVYPIDAQQTGCRAQ